MTPQKIINGVEQDKHQLSAPIIGAFGSVSYGVSVASI